MQFRLLLCFGVGSDDEIVEHHAKRAAGKDLLGGCRGSGSCSGVSYVSVFLRRSPLKSATRTARPASVRTKLITARYFLVLTADAVCARVTADAISPIVSRYKVLVTSAKVIQCRIQSDVRTVHSAVTSLKCEVTFLSGKKDIKISPMTVKLKRVRQRCIAR